MKRYYDLTDSEKLALSQDDFMASVKLEGIHRIIAPPITLDSLIRQGEFQSFSLPADSVTFFEVYVPGAYGSADRTGLCYQTADQARAAIVGAFCVGNEGYGAAAKNVIRTGDFSVRETYVTLTPQKWFNVKFEDFTQDNTAFEALCSECSDELSAIRQEAYNVKVRSTKRTQYMELAQGSEAIARAFWAKTESGEFPEA